MRGGGVQLGLHRMKDFLDVLHVDDGAMGVEHLDEAAHVRALEFLRQVHAHRDGGDGVLMDVRLVADLDGEAQPAHADLVDAQLTVVAPALRVVQRRLRVGVGGHCDKGIVAFNHALC